MARSAYEGFGQVEGQQGSFRRHGRPTCHPEVWHRFLGITDRGPGVAIVDRVVGYHPLPRERGRPRQPTKGRSRRSSWRAIERRCTASGPSTMRSTRAQA